MTNIKIAMGECKTMIVRTGVVPDANAQTGTDSVIEVDSRGPYAALILTL